MVAPFRRWPCERWLVFVIEFCASFERSSEAVRIFAGAVRQGHGFRWIAEIDELHHVGTWCDVADFVVEYAGDKFLKKFAIVELIGA